MKDGSGILNWRRVDGRLSTSGQPSAAQIAALSGQGVTDLMNLAPHEDPRALVGEAEIAAALGMKYVHIPVDFEDPTEADFERFCSAMADASARRVHVHCIMNMRVTAFLYRFRRDVLGEDDADARREMDAIWRPGGVWAAFIGDHASTSCPHHYLGDHP